MYFLDAFGPNDVSWEPVIAPKPYKPPIPPWYFGYNGGLQGAQNRSNPLQNIAVHWYFGPHDVSWEPGNAPNQY
jgi:hypothetical protein